MIIPVLKLALNWIFALFCLCTVPVYGLFSVTGFMGMLIGILALPISPVRKLWKRILPANSPRIAKWSLLLAAFCVMLAAAPTGYTNENLGYSLIQNPQTTLVPVPTQAPISGVDSTSQSSSAVAAESEKETTGFTSESVSVTEDDTKPSPTASASVDTEIFSQESTVYVAGSGNGTRYHSDPTCSRMKDPTALTREEAEAQGYTPCQRCYGG